MLRVSFAIIAYLTLIHNAIVVVVVVDGHFANASGGSTGVWGIEFTTIESDGAKLLLASAIWTSLVAIGCLWNVRVDRRECVCRACGYILRGLREPKCPECGESI